MPGSVNGRPRRSQEERRETTRRALLDATIDCVVDCGYAGVTTADVAKRAGVSRGAQVHHFATKDELVAEAVTHLVRRRADEFRDELRTLPSGRNRVERGLDLLWHTHSGPLFAAALELWVAARTDPALRRQIARLEGEFERGARHVIGEVLADAEGKGPGADSLELALSAMRGLALLGMLAPRDLEDEWARLRGQLITTLTPQSGNDRRKHR